MNEDQLRSLLTSISHLAEHGEIPVHAFGTLISSARGELIAEHLHQRWLSDPNFAKIAADIVLQLHGIENRNMTVCSQVLSLALRDFKSRKKIRKSSRHMFRNYMRTLIALYPVYRQIDKYLSACLIEPLFRSLQTLVDEKPDDNDLRCVANIIISSGQTLNQLNPTELDSTVMKCRRWLVSNIIQLEEETKFLLMEAVDLWTYSWDTQLFPDCLRRFYEAEKEQRLQDEVQRTALQKSGSSSSKFKLKRQATFIREYPAILTEKDEESEEEMREENVGISVPKVINGIGGRFQFEKEESIV
ncbi:MIF4G domain-containing protein [Ditylenchus destructor]|uniref:MIF4G domain-containing protein n=1 Tax=Ditylenchus destructor TaxID=166010 RepID=A0AAD4MYR7_9BILA|nr:MIF4G domain-containing protein [Ditylenchus destructor]